MRKAILIAVFTGIILSLYVAERGERGPEQAVVAQAGSSRLARLLSDDERGFPQALAAREFRFPDDHGPHPEYRNEWWYVTGNVDGESGERLGYELTLFRFALSSEVPPADSAWRSNQVFIGHFAVSDVADTTFHVAERYSRGSMGLAGADREPFRVWLEDWQIGADADELRSDNRPRWRLRANADTIAIDVLLVAQKPPVLNGIDGLSRKSSQPGNASYYYSLTRLQTEGVIRIGDRRTSVQGWSWLDREWGSSALAPDQAGWDWFAFQFDDQTELMLYNIRKLDGSADAMSAGTFVDADGNSVHLQQADMQIRNLDYWDSPAGGRYPSRWRISVPRLSLSVEVTPVMAAQELETSVRYWEGAVDISGRRLDRDIDGRGYVELTGYADQENAR